MSAPPLGLRYRTAFLTGASTGLGRAFAEMLLAEGVEVWGTARDTRRLPAQSRFHPIALELADGVSTERIFCEANNEAGGFDLVINNAGFGAFGGFADSEFSLWESQIQIMLVNTARLAHAALRDMQARSCGVLVNVSSLAAEFPLPYQPAYNVIKSGLSALSESLMLEFAGSKIVIIDFRPGDYRTDFEGSVRRSAKDFSPRQQKAWRAFHRLMESGPAPEHAAQSLRRALIHGRSGTVRSGRLFQAVVGPFLARLGSLALRRKILLGYFGL